jgi:3-oxoacyl-[acyl-carrier protein] reductase
MDENTRTACLARQPTDRLGTPGDIANVVSFLLSDKGGWINGQILKADGGFSS